MKDHFAHQQKGDGFVSIKTMKDDNVLYYELERLSTQESRLFIIHTEHDTRRFSQYKALGPYIFDLNVLIDVEAVIDGFIHNRIEPIYLDEVGILEAKKEFFFPIIKKVLDSNLDLIITVRESLVKEIIQVLGVTQYTILEER